MISAYLCLLCGKVTVVNEKNPLRQIDRFVEEYGLSTGFLKMAAFVCMMIDHFMISFMRTSDYYKIVRGSVGRVAYPVFLWLFFCGFFRSSSRKKQFVMLLCSAVISEFPFDVMVYGRRTGLFMKHQNVMFTWLLAFLLLYMLSESKKMFRRYEITICFDVFIILCFFGLFMYTAVDYTITTPCAVGVMYMLKEVLYNRVPEHLQRKIFGLAAVYFAAFCTFEPGCLLALPLVLCSSSEKRGKRTRFSKMFYYAGYPVHLYVYMVVRYVMGWV